MLNNHRYLQKQKSRNMHSLVKKSGYKNFIFTEMPSLTLAVFLSEALYKFGSFALECLAFLITWYLISFSFNVIITYRNHLK